MDFGVNTEEAEELITALENARIALGGPDGESGSLCDIYKIIEGMGESWSGESYDTFKGKCDDYKTAVYAIAALLAAFKKAVEDAKDNAEVLIVNVSNALTF